MCSFNFQLRLPWQLVLTTMWVFTVQAHIPYPCSDSLALTYTLGYSLPTIKEWGLVKEDCFDRLLEYKAWADNIVYCPNQLFCGTNLTLHFLNSFPPVTRRDARECEVYSTSSTACKTLEKLISKSDDNECSVARLGCGPCENFVGGYWCNCVDGFAPDANEHICSDVDECAKDPYPCDSIAGNCTNFVGFFRCHCNDGFEGDGFECRDIDECERPQSCHFKADCTNFPGNYSCKCQPGYEGDDPFKSCEDIDECDTNTDSCEDLTSYCLNHDGYYECFCKVGFDKTSDGGCDDYDECKEDEDLCFENSKCINAVGNYSCQCDDGYYKSGEKCSDKDECNSSPPYCGEGGQPYKCENSVFPFRCSCNTGFESTAAQTSCTGTSDCDGFKCIDKNECDNPSICSEPEVCSNTPGSYYCGCPDGYAEVNSMCISPVNILGQKLHTDAELDGKRMTSIELIYYPYSIQHDVILQLYQKKPLHSVNDYEQVSFYTKPFAYEKVETRNESVEEANVTTWSKDYTVFLVYPTAQSLAANDSSVSLFGTYYACVSSCGNSNLVKVCDLGDYMSLLSPSSGNNQTCGDWGGLETEFTFWDKVPVIPT